MEHLEQGSEAARDLLVEHNLRLVVFIARRFENTGVNLEDLTSFGNRYVYEASADPKHLFLRACSL